MFDTVKITPSAEGKWRERMDSLEALYVHGQITEEQLKERLAQLVEADDIWYYLDAASEAKEDRANEMLVMEH